ncbi:hypothetical protein OROHE_020502 [Orobanche hederae]
MMTKILSIEERHELYERMRGSIVCICEKTGKTDNLIGGGVFIEVGSRQLVLTAAHVVYKKSNLHIVSCDKKSYVVQQLHFDVKRDVALLDVLHKPDNGFECARLCEINELNRKSEIHFIGHPGRQTFTYNIGNISCAEKTCGDIYRDIGLWNLHKLQEHDLVDDFRELAASLRLVQAKNVHGGGRFGGTGAPFLDGDGNIVGLYSFTFQEEDHAVHVADIKASIMSLNGKGK